jgi:hypothetical protein
LLNHVATQIKTLNETTLHLSEGKISPPWSQLSLVRDNVTLLNNMLNTSSQVNLKLVSLSEEVEQNLKKKSKYSFVKVCQFSSCSQFEECINIILISQAKKLLKSSQINENEVEPLRELAESRLANSVSLEREVDGM